DWNVTWYTLNPDLTKCFQHTVLVWFPCFYLWVCSPLYLLYLRRFHHGRISFSRLCCAKTVLGVCLVLFGILELLYLVFERKTAIKHHMVFLLRPIIRSLTMVLAVCIIHLERIMGCRSSLFLFLYWMLTVICSIVPLKANIHTTVGEDFSQGAMQLVVFFFCFSLELAQLILSCFSDQRPHTWKPGHVMENPCPVEDASFLSKTLFWWFSGLVVKGYRSPLTAEDLWSLREEDTSEKIISDLEREWSAQCAELQHSWNTIKSLQACFSSMLRQERSVNASRTLSCRITEQTQLLQKLRQEQSAGFLLLRTLAKNFGPYFLSGTICLIFHDAFMFSIPQLLSLLLDMVRDKDAPLWKGYLFAFSMFLLSCLQSLFNHQYMYSCFTVGMRVKTAIMGLIYRKSLVMSSAARRTCTVGEIVNLVSTDTQKLMDFVVYFNAIWLAPIEISLCLFFLWQWIQTLTLNSVIFTLKRLGPSALAGITTVIFIFPLNGLIAKMRSKLQEFQMKHMDGRIKLMNEILSGIKILKFYAWEKAFEERVLSFREKELKAMKKSQIFYSISIASFNSSTFMIAFAMFGFYVLIDEKNVLDAQKVFVSLALINILKTPLSQLPFAMSTTMQAKGESIVIEDGCFSWSRDGALCLKRVSVKVPNGSLVAVVGHVGSGKSSLLSAVLGEMEKKSGEVTVKGSVAYVPQQAWIQNATLRENIIFGQQMKESSYQRVLEACALLPDLEILPGGDNTEIGEKGLNLSGGQKQRVSLARAVYRNADVYLLDDPLSAVDTHVGQHIFDKVIGPEGILKNKTRVLVTHGLSFLPKADLILVMGDGQITEAGSYTELLERRSSFADILKIFSNTEHRENSTNRGQRKSVSRLSMTDFSIDFSQEQLIRDVPCSCSGDMSSVGIQTMETLSDLDQEPDTEELGKLTEADKAHTGRGGTVA
ncbi:hypothetical protein QTP86_021137, partial [Hemibagrus guttatus]